MPEKKKKKVENEVNQETSAEVETAGKAEVVSVKKVIYIEIDDEVTSIYDKMKDVSGKHIYMVIPKRSILFQSVVNLKILKRKADDDDKKIHFITDDKNGIHLAQKLGISVYNKADAEGKPALFSTDPNDERLRITPLKASVNSIEEEAPTRLAERKLSISEILRKSKGKKSVDVSKIDSTRGKKPKKEKSRFVIIAPNRHALIGLVSISLIILLIIIYIALPGVTVFMTPSASVLEKSVNITLADFQKNRVELDTHPTQTIASYPINTTVSKTITHYATGKKFSERGANSSGTLTIINMGSNSWPLVAQTRFQTDEGLVFRILNGITVPVATSAGPGKVEAYVVADQVDAFGGIIGERGNIETGRFFLPGLKENSRSKLYAESYEPMTGGVTDYTTFILEEDIEAAKLRLSDELKKSAIEELRSAVKGKNELVGEGITYTLLVGEKASTIGEVSVTVPPGLEGKQVSEFTVSGEVAVSGVYYDHGTMLSILKDELLLKKSPQKELLRINEDSTTYRIFEWDDAGGKIKLTANIKGIEQYEIDPDKENGSRLLEKIKEHIVGKDIEEAKLYIQNLPEINKVEIDSWPAWSPTIPNIPDNIEFEIRDAITVE